MSQEQYPPEPRQSWHGSASHRPSVNEYLVEESWGHTCRYTVVEMTLTKGVVTTFSAHKVPSDDQMYQFHLTKRGEWIRAGGDSKWLYAGYQITWNTPS